MLRDSVQLFAGERSPVKALRALRDAGSDDGFDRTLWAEFARMGYSGILIPEAFGGSGLGYREAGLVMEAIGRNLIASPFFSSSAVAASLLLRAADAAQQQRWLPEIASGQCLATLAIDEGIRHDPASIECTARPTADGYVLDGSKRFVLQGHVADLLVVVARISGATGSSGPVGLFLVERDTPGLGVEPLQTVDAHRAAHLRFDNVSVSKDARLSGAADTDAGSKSSAAPFDADAAVAWALDAGRAAIAAEMVGIADEVFQRTLAYLKERRQFGRVIGEFQALQHRAAALYCDIELSRAAVVEALGRLDATQSSHADRNQRAEVAQAVSVAKAHAGRTVTLAVQEGVQMHGGIGMTDEFEMGFFMKRARVLQELFGDSDFHAERFARLHGY